MAHPKMVITVPDKGRQTYVINRLPLIVGRGTGCQIQITASEQVADQHVKLGYDTHTKRLIIEDLGSGVPTTHATNGPITSQHLDDGDSVWIADTRLDFFYTPATTDGAPLEVFGLAGPSAGKRFAIGNGDITIGRSGQNVVCIPKPNISGKHAVIRLLKDGRIAITDLNSRNGTRVNGKKVPEGKSRLLVSGDVIDIGPLSLIVQPVGFPRVPIDTDAVVPPTTKASAGISDAGGRGGDTRVKARLSPSDAPTRIDHGTPISDDRFDTTPSARPAPPVRSATAKPPVPALGALSTPLGIDPASETDSHDAFEPPPPRSAGAPPAAARPSARPSPAPSRKPVAAANSADDDEDFESLIDINDLGQAVRDVVARESAETPRPPAPPPPPPPPALRPTRGVDPTAETVDFRPSASPPPPPPPPPPARSPAAAALAAPPPASSRAQLPEDDDLALNLGALEDDENLADEPDLPVPPTKNTPPLNPHSAVTINDDNRYDDSPYIKNNRPGSAPPASANSGGGAPKRAVVGPPPQVADADAGYSPPDDSGELDLMDLAKGANFSPNNNRPASRSPQDAYIPVTVQEILRELPSPPHVTGPALVTLPAIPDEDGSGGDVHLTLPAALPVTGRITAGRRKANELRLPHGECSGQHAVFTPTTPSTVEVHDAGSLNGTFVNGQRITSHVLQPWDEIVIGPYRFLYVAAGAKFPPF